MLIELGDNVHLQRLIEGTHAAQPFPVGTPVEAHDRLGRDDTRVQQLDRSGNSDGSAVLGVLSDSVLGVAILVEVEPSVATSGHEEISVLRQVLGDPHGTAMGSLGRRRKAIGGMLRPHIVTSKLGLESRDDNLVHLDVGPIELQGRH